MDGVTFYGLAFFRVEEEKNSVKKIKDYILNFDLEGE